MGYLSRLIHLSSIQSELKCCMNYAQRKISQNNTQPRLIMNFSEYGRYTNQKGLYLIVDQSGAKHWVHRIVVNVYQRDLDLDSLNTVSVVETRHLAQGYRGVAISGEKPLSDQKEVTATIPTVGEAAWEAIESLIFD